MAPESGTNILTRLFMKKWYRQRLKTKRMHWSITKPAPCSACGLTNPPGYCLNSQRIYNSLTIYYLSYDFRSFLSTPLSTDTISSYTCNIIIDILFLNTFLSSEYPKTYISDKASILNFYYGHITMYHGVCERVVQTYYCF